MSISSGPVKRHQPLVSYIAVSILGALGWDSESTLHKICTASLLHDLSLSDGIIDKIASGDQLDTLTTDEKKNYLDHPEESSHLAKHFDAIANGIEQFILEHHELPNGKGFPRKRNYNTVHPLSATLHLADLAADLLWKHNFDINKVKHEINESRQFYQRGFYRKPYDALVSILKDTK